MNNTSAREDYLSYWHILETIRQKEDMGDIGTSIMDLVNYLGIGRVEGYVRLKRLYATGLIIGINRGESMNDAKKFILSNRAKGILKKYKIDTFLTPKNELILNSVRKAENKDKHFRMWSEFQIEGLL